MDYTIKPITTSDVEKLQKVSRGTIKTTFDPYTTPNNKVRCV